FFFPVSSSLSFSFHTSLPSPVAFPLSFISKNEEKLSQYASGITRAARSCDATFRRGSCPFGK
ncbi:hypothetical protein ACTRJ5_002934, partial [Klebsiella pneumoniae]